jgi:hypothetical protein
MMVVHVGADGVGDLNSSFAVASPDQIATDGAV